MFAGPVEALKILMAGSLERYEHQYFSSVATYLSENAETKNEVYLLQHEKNPVEFSEWMVTKVNDRLKTIQIGDLPLKNPDDPKKAKIERQVMRVERFFYNPQKTEYDNYVDLDIEHVKAYFDKDDQLLTKLKEMKFDVGIGGSYHADSLLFRALGLNFIKLVPEDIEAHTMQFKFNIPIMLSAYANSLAFNTYEFGELPSRDGHSYRKQFWKQYEYNRWIGRPLWMRKVRSTLPVKYHQELLHNYD